MPGLLLHLVERQKIGQPAVRPRFALGFEEPDPQPNPIGFEADALAPLPAHSDPQHSLPSAASPPAAPVKGPSGPGALSRSHARETPARPEAQDATSLTKPHWLNDAAPRAPIPTAPSTVASARTLPGKVNQQWTADANPEPAALRKREVRTRPRSHRLDDADVLARVIQAAMTPSQDLQQAVTVSPATAQPRAARHRPPQNHEGMEPTKPLGLATPVAGEGLTPRPAALVRPRVPDPEPASRQPAPSDRPEGSIQVTIGRIEIRTAPPFAPKKRATPGGPSLSLSDYLQRRG